jgi:hypothetical protein
MYVSVLVMVAAIGWWRGSPLVGLYAFILAVAFHARVVLHEEPQLMRSFAAGGRCFGCATRSRRAQAGHVVRARTVVQVTVSLHEPQTGRRSVSTTEMTTKWMTRDMGVDVPSVNSSW